MVAEELLARLRAGIGCDVEYAQPPVQLGGGFYTANYRFSLKDGPAGWNGPMVLRLFPTHAPDQLDAWEAAVQTFVHDRGVPAPAVTLREPGSTIEGRRWFVMELLSGAPAMEGINARQLVGGLRRMMRELPRQTAGVHLALIASTRLPSSTRSANWQPSSGGGRTSPHRPTTIDLIHSTRASSG